MSLFVSILFFVWSFVLLYFYLTANFSHWKKRNIRGPKPKPLVGNFPSIIFRDRHQLYEVDDIYRKYRKRESLVGVFAGRDPQIIVTDRQIVRSLFIGNFKSFHDNEASFWTNKKIDRTFGQNPFTLAGQEWKEKRSEIIPALTVSKLKMVYPIIQDRCGKLRRFIEKQSHASSVKEDGFDARDLAYRFTLDIIFASAFGVEAGALDSVDCEILQIGKTIVDGLNNALPQLSLLSLAPIIKWLYRPTFVPRDCEQRYIDIMKSSYELREKSGIDHPDIVNYLIQLQKKKNLPESELAAHAFTFFFDGFETASAAITNTLLLLSRNKDVQDRLRNEINREIETEGALTYERLLDLPYLDQCINEALRVYPPLMLSVKICTESCELTDLKGNIQKVQKSDTLIIPVYSIHRDPEYYPNPHEYNPDRFSAEHGGVKKFKEMGAFIPFGDGPRICIGMKYATAMLKSIIAEIISNWEISSNSKTTDECVIQPVTFLCAIEDGVWLDLKPIKKNK